MWAANKDLFRDAKHINYLPNSFDSAVYADKSMAVNGNFRIERECLSRWSFEDEVSVVAEENGDNFEVSRLPSGDVLLLHRILSLNWLKKF